MSLVWKLPIKSHTEKLVFLALADNANDEGVCWPSLTTLAKKCSLTRQGIINQIQKLQRDGFLEVEKGDWGRSNCYLLRLPSGVVNAINPNGQKGGERDTLPVVNTVANLVNTVDPNHQEPSIEPSTPLRGVQGGEEEGMSPKMVEVWREWVSYRKAKPSKVKDWRTMFRKQSEQLKQYDEDTALWSMNNSMMNGYTALSDPGRRPTHKTSQNGELSGIDKAILSKEYDRVLEKIRQIQAGYSENQSVTSQDHARLIELRSRRTELRQKLGILI